MQSDIPEGYSDAGFQASGIIFPTEGCWEVTGKAGNASLTFVTLVVKVAAPPTPTATVVAGNGEIANPVAAPTPSASASVPADMPHTGQGQQGDSVELLMFVIAALVSVGLLLLRYAARLEQSKSNRT